MPIPKPVMYGVAGIVAVAVVYGAIRMLSSASSTTTSAVAGSVDVNWPTL